MKIIFFGTSNVALPVLEMLHKNHSVVGVVTTPDSVVGRKKELSESPVALLAKELKLKIFQPEKVKGNSLFRLEIQNLQADLFVVVSYGKILPLEILEIPKLKTINVHFSLLPKYRGPSPIQAALLNGDSFTGTSIFVLDEKIDHGPMLTAEKFIIQPDDNFITLSQRLAHASAKLLQIMLPDYEDGRLIGAPQNHELATFTKIINKEDGRIVWENTAQQIYNHFRAFYPWPGIWTTWNGKKLKITECVASKASFPNSLSGQVLEGGFIAAGQSTALSVNRVQLEGRTEMSMKEFLNGYQNFFGSKVL